jgi:translation elongation factor EF-1alpha
MSRATCRGVLVMLFGLFGCDRREQPAETAAAVPGFSFTVQDVFYIKPPVDRVILTGVVDEGSVQVGDELTVHTQKGPIAVKLDMVEFPDKQADRASKGDQVGLRLAGIAKDQAQRGDRVTKLEKKSK